jgi:hypothetical protein
MAVVTTQAGRTRPDSASIIAFNGAVLSDFVEIVGVGAPPASAQATLNFNPAGDDNSLTITAADYGPGGNDISIAYVDPEANDAELTVTVEGKAITVSLATDETGTIITTAAEIDAALEANEEADALVIAQVHAGDSGSGDDGSGVVTAMARDNLEGGTGVGVGVAGIGSRYTAVNSGVLYLNTGTKSVPEWTEQAPV